MEEGTYVESTILCGRGKIRAAGQPRAWYKTIAPTYAGVMLWFVFWQDLAKGTGTPGGVLASGLGPALLGLVVAALICHFFFYLVPGTLGMRTGLPLYIVGTSTYGVQGGLFMPGLLMGLLQFGWLAVNAWATSTLLCMCFNLGMAVGPSGCSEVQVPGLAHGIIAAVFAIVAAFVGLKGIKYVARVATYLPLIPMVVLIILLAKTGGGLAEFGAQEARHSGSVRPQGRCAGCGLSAWMVVAVLCMYIVGFFATAGAAGTDIASIGRRRRGRALGGLGGIILPTVVGRRRRHVDRRRRLWRRMAHAGSTATQPDGLDARLDSGKDGPISP